MIELKKITKEGIKNAIRISNYQTRYINDRFYG